MKKILSHNILIILAFISLNLYAQNSDIKGYRLEGDEIVFSFDKRDYKKVSGDYYGLKRDFDDLNIENVVVSGEFNNWSKDKWRMTKIDENRYELRKKIDDFTDEFSWEFKFVINNSYWAEPSKNTSNITKAMSNGFRLGGVYNLKMYTAFPDKNGNACFKLYGYDNAKKVVVAGSFNKWDEDIFKMNKVEDGWELTLQMKPEKYQYRFIVDGKWMEDPNNTNKIENEFGEYNSIIDIKTPVTFELLGYLNAHKVVLSGSFNAWNEEQIRMKKTNKGWNYTLLMPSGKHHYKFIVDGEWLIDPSNSVKEYDDNGYINSVCMVK